jgi:hypothetical protein
MSIVACWRMLNLQVGRFLSYCKNKLFVTKLTGPKITTYFESLSSCLFFNLQRIKILIAQEAIHSAYIY